MKLWSVLFASVLLAGCSGTRVQESRPLTPAVSPEGGEGGGWPHFTLMADQITLVELPDGKQFDASGLLRLPSGALLTLANNVGPQLYRIEFEPSGDVARLVPTDWFTPEQVIRELGLKPRQLDCEGIAVDSQGRLYVCEESRRWILRCNPRSNSVERLPIDWSSVKRFFSSLDANASFEGIAIGGGRLFVANEREAPVILEVDLEQLQVSGHFKVSPQAGSFFGTHYSDLCWFEERLWVLCRQHRVVLEVDPKTQRVLAELDYRKLEDDLSYRTGLPVSVGLMEGLAVDPEFIWLLIDNNGMARQSAPKDIRPTLVRCRRPDRSVLNRVGAETPRR